MAFVKVAFPESPSDLAMMVCLLEAHSVPYFVHNAGFGGLYPGVQIALYNNMTVMVPASAADDALELLSVLSDPSTIYKSNNILLSDKIRMVIEAFIFSWFIPRRRRKNDGNRA